ncbi:MAG TPA: sugar phosphate isomerase/epimerase [Acidobacteriaceae bacterium]|nr:sugar phosphate isomerase/epimerase [Acidobacteriaceae bacterium]
MQPGISTHVFFQHRLHPGLLDALASSGARTIEIFAARHHFDYTDAPAVRELAAWFRSNPARGVLHQPVYITDRADTQWSRHVAPNLNLIAPEKFRRIAAMDEVKRALESAEMVPFAAVVLDLGLRDTRWDDAAIEHSLTAIEHLKAFAGPLGLKLLLENTQNEVTTPAHLRHILEAGHFDTVGVSLDLGRLHLAQDGAKPANDSGVGEAVQLLAGRIGQLHVNDNHGPFAPHEALTDSAISFQNAMEMKDEHLWPGEGTIAWSAINAALAPLGPDTPGILEIAADRDESPDAVARKARTFFEQQQRAREAQQR